MLNYLCKHCESFRRKSLQLNRDARRLETRPLHPGSGRFRQKSGRRCRSADYYFRTVGTVACPFYFRSARVQRFLSDHVQDTYRPANRHHALQLPQRSRGTRTGSSLDGKRGHRCGRCGLRRRTCGSGRGGRSKAAARSVRPATTPRTAASDDKHQPRCHLLRRRRPTPTDETTTTSVRLRTSGHQLHHETRRYRSCDVRTF